MTDTVSEDTEPYAINGIVPYEIEDETVNNQTDHVNQVNSSTSLALCTAVSAVSVLLSNEPSVPVTNRHTTTVFIFGCPHAYNAC